MQKSATSSSSDFPLVSVIAPCYNQERFVIECLESIRAQDYPNLQIIVVDDCSQDASPKLIRDWIKANPSLQVIFVQNEQNLGVCKSMNRGLNMATGKYIARVDTDDVWEPRKISGQVRVMDSLPETTAVLYSDVYRMNESGALLPRHFIENHRAFNRMPEGNIHEVMWNGNFIPFTTTLIRRSVFEKVGNYDEDLFYDDWDMWLRISKDFHFAYYPEPTAKYRIVNTSISNSSINKMNLADEIMFTKYLLQGLVPKSMRNQAANFAVRRIFRERSIAFGKGLDLLNRMIRLYGSPRLLYAWLLYRCGLEYKYYQLPLWIVKQVTSFMK